MKKQEELLATHGLEDYSTLNYIKLTFNFPLNNVILPNKSTSKIMSKIKQSTRRSQAASIGDSDRTSQDNGIKV